MKILARDTKRRPQDLIDNRHILAVAQPEVIERARGAPGLIATRSYQRDKVLLTELGELGWSLGS